MKDFLKGKNTPNTALLSYTDLKLIQDNSNPELTHLEVTFPTSTIRLKELGLKTP